MDQPTAGYPIHRSERDQGRYLLAVIVADTIINPRDEQTAQQGDI